MEAENKLYADMHGDGQGQRRPDPPGYVPTMDQQPQGQSQGFPPPVQPAMAAASPYYAPQGQLPPYPPKYTPTLEQQQPQGGQFQGFPPYGHLTGVACAGYGIPAPAPLQQQQQQVTVVAANQSPVVYVQHVESYSGAIVYACVVLWLCNWLFGLIAFILASEYMLQSAVYTVYCMGQKNYRQPQLKAHKFCLHLQNV